jgi:hypothetical protein
MDDDLKIGYVSATQKTHAKDTPLLQSMKELGGDFDVCCYKENTRSLASVYNEAIGYAKNYIYDVLVLVHDDVWLQHDPKPQLKRLFKDYDLIGVAGCSRAEIKTPALWHLMGGGFGSGHLHGAVAHGAPDYQSMSSFGPYPHPVVMIDGVFMALGREILQDETMRFDETYPTDFHFYDLDFSHSAHKAGYKVGVGDIGIIHESPGLREYTDEWKTGNEYFIKKHG